MDNIRFRCRETGIVHERMLDDSEYDSVNGVRLTHKTETAFWFWYRPEFPPLVASEGSIGIDVRTTEAFTIEPGRVHSVRTGTSWQVESVPALYKAELQVRNRSGLGKKRLIGSVLGVGTVDQDYIGEIEVLLVNLGQKPQSFQAGDRVGQLVFALKPKLEGLSDFNENVVRGQHGFGSTGV